MPKRTKHLTRRILNVSLLSYILLIFLLSLNQYNSSISQSRKLVLDKLNSVAMTGCSQLDTAALRHLKYDVKEKDAITSNDQNTYYSRLHEQLAEIHRKNELSTPVYIMEWDEKEGHFEFLCTSSPTPYFRHTFTQFPSSIHDNYESGGKVGPYESENGTWLSAFTPIPDNQGNVMALLQVDQEFSKFKEEALYEFFKFLAVSLLIALLFFGIIFYFLRNISREAEENEEELERSFATVNHQKSELQKAKKQIEQYNKTLEDQVKERTEKLTKANQELDQFVYRASHNLRAPLTSLIELISVTKDEPSEKLVKEYLDYMEETSEKLDKVIRDIIDYSKNNRIEVQCEAVHLKSLAEEIIEENEDAFKKQKNQITFHYHSETPESSSVFFTDKTRIRIVLNNLIANAISHADPNKNEALIEVALHQKSNSLIILVTDNGLGIDPEIEDRIYDLFFVGNPHSQGSGIGLYVVQEVIQKLEGKISFTSTIGKGTTFTVNLPNMRRLSNHVAA